MIDLVSYEVFHSAKEFEDWQITNYPTRIIHVIPLAISQTQTPLELGSMDAAGSCTTATYSILVTFMREKI